MSRIPDSVLVKVPKFTREETKDIIKFILQEYGFEKKPKSVRFLLCFLFEREWPEKEFGKYGLDGKIFDTNTLFKVFDEIHL